MTPERYAALRKKAAGNFGFSSFEAIEMLDEIDKARADFEHERETCIAASKDFENAIKRIAAQLPPHVPEAKNVKRRTCTASELREIARTHVRFEFIITGDLAREVLALRRALRPFANLDDGYLENPSSLEIEQYVRVGDIRRARRLLQAAKRTSK